VGVTTSLTLYVEVLDPTVRPGLPGALLSAAIKSPRWPNWDSRGQQP
jgi:hypothetical protein